MKPTDGIIYTFFIVVGIAVCVSVQLRMAQPTSASSSGTDSKTAAASVTKCPLARHIAHFATKSGQLTTDSMTEGHTVQDIHDGVYVKCWAIQNLMTDRKLPHTLNHLLTVNNPARTGLWTAEGEFDEKAFEDLSTVATHDSRELVMTEEAMTKWLAKRHHGKELGKATSLGYIVPVEWEAVTAGSIKELFLYYADTSLQVNDKKVPAMTMDKLKRFYTDPEAVVQERLNQLHNQKHASLLSKTSSK
jgi:hypothetical protein